MRNHGRQSHDFVPVPACWFEMCDVFSRMWLRWILVWNTVSAIMLEVVREVFVLTLANERIGIVLLIEVG